MHYKRLNLYNKKISDKVSVPYVNKDQICAMLLLLCVKADVVPDAAERGQTLDQMLFDVY